MDMLLTRQAIYLKDNSVFAYDLIFDESNSNDIYDRDIEEKRVSFICNYGTLGLNKFTNNKKALVAFTEISLFEDIPDLLGKDNIIIKLSENIMLTKEMKKDLIDLKNKGFIIALDYKENSSLIKDFSDFVEIIIIDFSLCSKDKISELLLGSEKNKFLAKNINSQEQYDFAVSLGFSYFEGELFSRPTIIFNKDISVRNSNRFNLIIQLLNDDIDIDKIEHIVKSDLSISYKLVRFLNSPVFGFVQEINSIRQAIVLLGKEELRKWLTLIIVSGMQDTSNEEITNNIIIRGRFCELVAEKIVPQKKSQAFLTGIFSELDLLMDSKMEDIVSDMQVDGEVKLALLGSGNILNDILHLVIAYEKMEVKNVEKISSKIRLDKSYLFDLYSSAIDWLNESMMSFNK